MNIAASCYASAAYSAVRRPSVCHVRIVSKQTTILVFPYQNLWQRADGDPLTGRRMHVKNGNSSPSGPGRAWPPNAFWCNSKPKFQISGVLPNCKKTQMLHIYDIYSTWRFDIC